ncbi:Transthyretin-like family-containing protein [Strongyloides ratti]|uniref:Transthyretin-like family-containing protein n=1 Tax=Strongyloides ratti TaxID=34506 RepID=A0A090N010_STRRB|nr:Transthyretin-like family-containing protein [Strongyloides ratti]CEF69870.2 Transthyretin-like family-containing protein [Strongyloides ratti]
MTIKIIFIILLFFTYVLPELNHPKARFWWQIFCMKMTFLCSGQHQKNVRIVTYDYTAGIYSKVGYQNLGNSSYISYCGLLDGLFKFHPYLYIYHQCNETNPMCEKEIYFQIPKEYVFWGTNATKTYVDNKFELNKTYKGEMRQCIIKGKLIKNVPYGKESS